MPSDRAAVYWDSCVFISRIQGDPERIDLLRQLTSLAEKGKLLIVTSVLTIAEVLRTEHDGSNSLRDRPGITSRFHGVCGIAR